MPQRAQVNKAVVFRFNGFGSFKIVIQNGKIMEFVGDIIQPEVVAKLQFLRISLL